MRHDGGGLGERLDEGEECLEPLVGQLAGEHHQFIEQNDAWPGEAHHVSHQLPAGIGAGGFRLGDQGQARIAGEAPGDVAPRRIDFGPSLEPERHIRPFGGADEDRNLRALPLGYPDGIREGRDAVERGEGLGVRQVEGGEHGVGLAAAEGGLEPDHRVSALTGEPLQHAAQHTFQPFGEEGDAEEALSRRVVLGRHAGIDGGEVRGEFGFLEAVGEHVRMR